MSLKDAIEHVPQQGKPVTRQPSGGQWAPTVTLTESEGTAVSGVLAHEADERTLIAGWQLDPDVWEIVPGTLTVNRWQQHDACDDWLYQYKARLIVKGENPRADVDELVNAIARHKPRKLAPSGDHALVLNLSDWQAGKGEGGGTPAFIDRYLAAEDAAEERLRRLRKLYDIGQVVLVSGGDLAERCSGNYPSQAFTTDMNEREQQRVVRRLLLGAVTRFARIVPDVLVSGVTSNHGENRQNGKAFTDPGDNQDLAVLEAVYEAIGTNPEAYGHVKFHIPADTHVVALDVRGVRAAWSHGHIARKGATPQQKQVNWWMGQAFGDDPAGKRYTGLVDAQLLTTFHYHHFAAAETHGRLWLQGPAMDGGSRWFTDSTGDHSQPGMLTYLCGPRGVREIEVVA